MSDDVWEMRYRAGKVRGIEVAVCARPRSEEYHVQLLGTFEGISDIGEPFIGRNAKRLASVFAESILASLECADITWSK
ncbi:hypothetical protein GCM10011491_31090 [Brucella endophytica]|uniref:Uncharacterized protein n=1 Tax=Brucella endophytica TaxID=1963359 RepID=A0A916WIK1_9HYPH|nr:hypothetical protein [Brucella endophytica]GGB00680.1 hypothetical protein GCM10011491_31090 [Brucella endophytica]